MRTLNLKALSALVGKDESWLSKQARKPGFPKDRVNGRDMFDADEVRAWIAQNVRERKRASQAVQTSAIVPPASSAPAMLAPGLASRIGELSARVERAGADFGDGPEEYEFLSVQCRLKQDDLTAHEKADLAGELAEAFKASYPKLLIEVTVEPGGVLAWADPVAGDVTLWRKPRESPASTTAKEKNESCL